MFLLSSICGDQIRAAPYPTKLLLLLATPPSQSGSLMHGDELSISCKGLYGVSIWLLFLLSQSAIGVSCLFAWGDSNSSTSWTISGDSTLTMVFSWQEYLNCLGCWLYITNCFSSSFDNYCLIWESAEGLYGGSFVTLFAELVLLSVEPFL